MAPSPLGLFHHAASLVGATGAALLAAPDAAQRLEALSRRAFTGTDPAEALLPEGLRIVWRLTITLALGAALGLLAADRLRRRLVPVPGPAASTLTPRAIALTAGGIGLLALAEAIALVSWLIVGGALASGLAGALSLYQQHRQQRG